MLGSKVPNNDANGLFRATHSHNPTRYSHIMVLTPHFYAHNGAGLKVILPPVCKHTWFQTFWPRHHDIDLWKDTFWSASYYLSTAGGANLDVVKAYIEKQGMPKRT